MGLETVSTIDHGTGEVSAECWSGGQTSEDSPGSP